MVKTLADGLPVVTRRAFLRGLTAIGGLGAAYSALSVLDLLGGGALAAGSTTEALPVGSLNGKRVVVIGAGLAGLCSALRLARAGADVEVLEATSRVGGRSLTLRDGGTYSEWDWNTPTTMRFEQVGDVPPTDPGNYWNAGPGRIPQHHGRVIDYCKMLGVELQPYIYKNGAALLQSDSWNGGKPVQMRRLHNDANGELAELLGKVQNQGALDKSIEPSDVDAFLGLLTQFGQLSADGARLVYQGAAIRSFFPRTGYRIQPGNVASPGQPWPKLSLNEILQSNFWQSDMFGELSYAFQATLLQPVDGMDMIVRGFQRAAIPGGRTVGDLVVSDQPVRTIDMDGDKVRVVTPDGPRMPADFVVVTVAPPLLAGFDGNFLDGPARSVLKQVTMYAACKVGVQARSRFWEEEDRIYGGISWTSGITRQIWYPSHGFNSATGVLTAAYNHGPMAEAFQKLSRAERVETTLEADEKLHPGFRTKVFGENAVTVAWAKMPYQAGAFAGHAQFDQPQVFAEMVSLNPIGRKIFIAGDWFSRWPAWQVGALDSAHYATDGIARIAADPG